MYNNIYLGTDETKSWRNMIQSAATGEDALPTCASGHDSSDDAPPYRESGHSSSGDQVQDPDTR